MIETWFFFYRIHWRSDPNRIDRHPWKKIRSAKSRNLHVQIRRREGLRRLHVRGYGPIHQSLLWPQLCDWNRRCGSRFTHYHLCQSTNCSRWRIVLWLQIRLWRWKSDSLLMWSQKLCQVDELKQKKYYQESYEIPSFYQVFIEENERKSCAIVDYFCTLII